MLEYNKLSVIAYDFTASQCDCEFNTPHHGDVFIEKRKLKRYYSIGTEQGILSAKKTLKASGIGAHVFKERVGLYTAQYGYLHPSFDDLLSGLCLEQVNNANVIYPMLWTSPKVNPFLVTHSLSNNLLGLISQELDLQADCASFLRGNIGLISAFIEAELLLSTGQIDYALIVLSGLGEMGNDISAVSKRLEFGASFLLEKCYGKRKGFDVELLSHAYSNGDYSENNVLFITSYIKELIMKDYPIENGGNYGKL